jgi:hypothetical protein
VRSIAVPGAQGCLPKVPNVVSPMVVVTNVSLAGMVTNATGVVVPRVEEKTSRVINLQAIVLMDVMTVGMVTHARKHAFPPVSVVPVKRHVSLVLRVCI